MSDESQPAKNIHQAMVAIMRDAGHIGKDTRNQQQGFNYRGIDDVYNALHSLMARHGVFCTTECLDRWREERTTPKGGVLAFTVTRIKFTFWAEDGSCVSSVIDGEGMDSGDKSTNKSLAIAHKYALLQAFCIPTKEMADPDAESPELGYKRISEQQVSTLMDMIESTDSKMADFLKYAQVATMEEIRATEFDRLMTMLRAKQKRQQEAGK